MHGADVQYAFNCVYTGLSVTIIIETSNLFKHFVRAQTQLIAALRMHVFQANRQSTLEFKHDYQTDANQPAWHFGIWKPT